MYLNRIALLVCLLALLVSAPGIADAQTSITNREQMQRLMDQLSQMREQTRTLRDFNGGVTRSGGGSVATTTRDTSGITCSVTVDKYTITPGDKVKLSWESTGAEFARVPHFGRVRAEGTKTVSPKQSTSYDFRFFTKGGKMKDCRAFVHVAKNDGRMYTASTTSGGAPQATTPVLPTVFPKNDSFIKRLIPQSTLNRRSGDQQSAAITAIEGQIDALMGYLGGLLK